MHLADYIEQFFKGVRKDFAAAQGVKPAQITQWLKKDFIVVNGILYSPRRSIKKEVEND